MHCCQLTTNDALCYHRNVKRWKQTEDWIYNEKLIQMEVDPDLNIVCLHCHWGSAGAVDAKKGSCHTGYR